jgi:hypothetical protein
MQTGSTMALACAQVDRRHHGAGMYAQPVPAVACAASGPAGCTTQQLRKGTVPSSSSTCHVVAAVAGAEQLASQSQVEAYYRVQQ